MKQFFNITIAVIFFASVLTIAAEAQTSAQRVTATVPFAFVVGNKTLPAGKYAITVLNPSSDRKALQIRSSDGQSSAIILTNGVIGTLAENSKLIFDHYDDQYVFARAQIAGESTSLAALRGKSELKQLAKANKKSLVVVAAK